MDAAYASWPERSLVSVSFATHLPKRGRRPARPALEGTGERSSVGKAHQVGGFVDGGCGPLEIGLGDPLAEGVEDGGEGRALVPQLPEQGLAAEAQMGGDGVGADVALVEDRQQ